jgi:hypothetical protein
VFLLRGKEGPIFGVKSIQTICNPARVARFFFALHTKMGKYIQNGLKIYQVAVKFSEWT